MRTYCIYLLIWSPPIHGLAFTVGLALRTGFLFLCRPRFVDAMVVGMIANDSKRNTLLWLPLFSDELASLTFQSLRMVRLHCRNCLDIVATDFVLGDAQMEFVAIEMISPSPKFMRWRALIQFPHEL